MCHVSGNIYFTVLDVKRRKDLTSSRHPSSLDLGMAIPRTASAVLTQQLSRIRTTFPTMMTCSRRHKYALACAVYVYDSSLPFLRPHHDICDFIKKCAPSVYKEHGKVISHFGALRVTVQQVCEYAGCGKAKQLGWDRAYNSEGELCYVCYYDGGNAAYAGFMRALLSPAELQQLFNSTNVKEELLGDTLELALGILTIATRHPQHFPNWGGPNTTNACIRGIERSFWVYANVENIKLVTAPTPRNRNPPKREAEICRFIEEMTDVLNPDFLAIMDTDALQPVSGEVADGSGDVVDEAISGAEVAPPVPDHAEVYEDVPGEPAGTDLGEMQKKLKARVVENLTMLQSGTADVENNRMLTFCVACGDSRHTVTECENLELASAATKGLEVMLHAMLEYPNNIAPAPASTEPAAAESSRPTVMEVDDTASNASSGRRPKAKARPRRVRVVTPEWRLIMNDNLHVLAQDVGNRRGKFLICGVEISTEGPESEEKAMEIIEERSSHRDRRLPQRGDTPIYPDNEAYRCMGERVRCGLLDIIPYNGARFFHNSWDGTNHSILRDMTPSRRRRAKWVGRVIQKDLRHHLARPQRTWMIDPARVNTMTGSYRAMKVVGYTSTTSFGTMPCGVIRREV